MKRYRIWPLVGTGLLGILLSGPSTSLLQAQTKKSNKKEAPPPTVEQLMRETRPAEDFKATIFATPDQANYPVFISAAPDGTLYVGSDQNGSLARDKHMGRIFRLRDTDGDGRADEVKTFVKDIDSPRGLAWDIDRLYVLHPPHLGVFVDKDGSGEAGEEKILVKNIAFTFKDRPADHTSNGITLGLDGWIYAAIGDFGFMEAEGTDGRKLQLRGGGVVRVRTDGTGLELFSYGTRNILQVAVSPLLDGFARDNTNDGDGWDVRFHHISGFENHGYPRFYKNFADEEVTPLADYGGGAGCGAAWIDDPRWPKKWNNRPFTADWGNGAIFAHPVEASGSTFIEKGKPSVFVRLPRPTDVDVDANGRAYVSSWRNGLFTYDGPNVGYITRIEPKDMKPEPLPDFAKLSPEALKKLMLETAVYKIRLESQRRLLRAPQSTKIDAELKAAVTDSSYSIPARLAALAYIQQKKGNAAFLASIASQNGDMSGYAVRFLGENPETTKEVAKEAVAECLKSAYPKTRLEALIAATRIGFPGEWITKLLGDSDALIAHTTVQCLAKREASAACFGVLDDSSVSKQARVGASRALAMMHTLEVVKGLISRLEKESVADRRQDILTALCRLYYKEAVWKGESWGTRPDYRGPYYAPVVWEGSAEIGKVLEKTLSNADALESVFLGEILAKNRVKIGDPLGRLVDLAKKDPKSLPVLVEQLTKAEEVPPSTLDLLIQASQQKELTGKSVGSLVRINQEKAYRAAFAAAEKEKESQRTIIGAPYRDQYLPFFTEKVKSGSSLAYAVLLKIAASPMSVVESKELASKLIEEDWRDPKKRETLLAGAVLGNDRSLAKNIVEVVDKGGPESDVAAHALKALKLDATRVKAVFEAVGPKIKEMKVEEALTAGIKAKGEIWRGEQLFNAARCAVCHTISPDQVSKGPYLGNIAKTYRRKDLAESILLPSKTIAQGFQTNIFNMDDGKTYTGYVTREAADKVTIRDDKGTEIVLTKKNIERRTKSNISVMPEGLLAELKVIDLASLLDYLEDLAAHEPITAKKPAKK